MKIVVKTVELQCKSFNNEKYPNPDTEIKQFVTVYLDEENPFVQAMEMLIVNAIYHAVQEKYIGDSLWKLEGIEGIEVFIEGRVNSNTLKLP
ncbi:MAG: hypothetical protein A3J55_01705 [Candidatus Ryanbacteria bacterium RIFCSPHIGHO2_02_FULL_45_17b]|uniref:Uncharacterized protein n=1 Tax=Candidatus Ryanbacteria bacterium RIFCSPHIGHO2_01_FULL_45_22 TaxID=1802114 RepID=A0A1G2G388_9BACT|nr:MAG: hypothetical protein A2719_04365 [Candidatus Ryanbacteria bacterium RIFCSPHIGHO2_01_FULL_45_22]OGZ47620.1 MAG: hypothetical protein A3J55_01705 [Candidatus Ryanbacteria bacterium RIFCSPHIGHO2_02_FULL_45_17b]